MKNFAFSIFAEDRESFGDWINFVKQLQLAILTIKIFDVKNIYISKDLFHKFWYKTHARRAQSALKMAWCLHYCRRKRVFANGWRATIYSWYIIHEEDQEILSGYDYAVYALTYTIPHPRTEKTYFSAALLSRAMRLPAPYLVFYHRERRPLRGNAYFLHDGDNECRKEGIYFASL